MGSKISRNKRRTIDNLSEETVGAIEALDLNKDQDPSQNFPREIIDKIFSYLDPASIKTVRLVSRLS